MAVEAATAWAQAHGPLDVGDRGATESLDADELLRGIHDPLTGICPTVIGGVDERGHAHPS